MALRNVCICLENMVGFGEPVRNGIARFGQTSPGWSYDGPSVRNLATMSRRVLQEFDGFLGAFGQNQLRRHLATSDRPVVDMLHGEGEPPLPTTAVISDEHTIGRLAVQHLLDRGFRRLVCVGHGKTPAAVERTEGMSQEAEQAGVEPTILWASDGQGDLTAKIEQVLGEVTFPLGVATSEDAIARFVVETARKMGIRVPDELAVVGVNDSMLTCNFSIPPLSSVAPDWERIGFEASSLLDRLMAGETPPRQAIRIPPLGVTSRRSSDALAIDDENVVAAIEWIREHEAKPASVQQMVDELALVRRTLERQMRHFLGHSPWQELRRTQIEHVKRLLIQTDWAMPRVAAASAFRDAKDLCTQFRKFTGQTPTQFRRRHRTM